MTTEEFLKLTDREKDALVAENVMGYVRCEKHPNSYCHAYPESPSMGGETRAYSTDISCAWTVLQKFLDEDEDNRITIYPSRTVHNECEVGTIYWDRSKEDDPVLVGEHFTLATTCPLAICTAILKAKGVI